MPYKMNQNGSLDYSLGPQGFEGVESVINQRPKRKAPGIYEAYGAEEPSKWGQFGEAMVMGGLPMALGGAASHARGEGFGAGMAEGGMQGIENIFKYGGAQEKALKGRQQKILQSPEMMSAYERSKQKFEMFEDDAPDFQTLLQEELAGESEAALKAKKMGTSPLGLLSQEYGVPEAWKMWKESKEEDPYRSDIQQMKSLNRVDRVFNQRRDDIRMDAGQRLDNKETIRAMSDLNNWYNNAMVDVDAQRKPGPPPSYTPGKVRTGWFDIPAEFPSDQPRTQGQDLSLPTAGGRGVRKYNPETGKIEQ